MPDVDHFLEDNTEPGLGSLLTLNNGVLGGEIENLPFGGSGLT